MNSAKRSGESKKPIVVGRSIFARKSVDETRQTRRDEEEGQSQGWRSAWHKPECMIRQRLTLFKGVTSKRALDSPSHLAQLVASARTSVSSRRRCAPVDSASRRLIQSRLETKRIGPSHKAASAEITIIVMRKAIVIWLHSIEIAGFRRKHEMIRNPCMRHVFCIIYYKLIDRHYANMNTVLENYWNYFSSFVFFLNTRNLNKILLEIYMRK